MERNIENKDKVLMENAYFNEYPFYVHGHYGLSYFDIVDERGGDGVTWISKSEFLKLYDLMTEMKKEIDRLDNL
jgi:hypothetical protein